MRVAVNRRPMAAKSPLSTPTPRNGNFRFYRAPSSEITSPSSPCGLCTCGRLKFFQRSTMRSRRRFASSWTDRHVNDRSRPMMISRSLRSRQVCRFVEFSALDPIRNDGDNRAIDFNHRQLQDRLQDRQCCKYSNESNARYSRDCYSRCAGYADSFILLDVRCALSISGFARVKRQTGKAFD